MIKKLRLVKVLTGSLGAVSLLSFGSGIVTSCSKKADNHSLAQFIKSAKAESAANVIKNASIKAQGWAGWVNATSVFTKEVSTNKMIVIMVINFKSSNEIATFRATYTKGEAYKVDVWKCYDQPKNNDGKIHTELQFRADAQNAVLIKGAGNDIATKATPSQSGWKSDDGFKVIGALVINNDHTVTVTIADRKQTQKAVYTATYTSNRTYQTIDWSANGASSISKDDLDFSKIVLPGVESGTENDYVTQTIAGVVYVGGVGGLWSSTDDKTFTKVKMNSDPMTNATKVIGIVEQGSEQQKNVFVATAPVGGAKPDPNIGLLSAVVTPGTPLIFSSIAGDYFSHSLIMTSIAAYKEKVYVGTTTGIFKSAGAGNKWLTTNFGGASNYNITKLQFMNGKIWATTEKNGIWRSPVNQPGKDDNGTVFSNFEFKNLGDIKISWMKYTSNNSYAYIASPAAAAGLYVLHTGKDDGNDGAVRIWTPPTAKDEAYNISTIGNIIYLSTNVGLYVSPIAASLNLKIDENLGKTISVSNVVIMHDTLYAITNKGLYTSAGYDFDNFNLTTKIQSTKMDRISTDGTHVFIHETGLGLYTSEIKS